MKKFLIGVLSLGALASLASCELPGSDPLTEEQWAVAKHSQVKLYDDMDNFTIETSGAGAKATYHVVGGVIEAVGAHPTYAKGTNTSTGISYVITYYDDSTGTAPGYYDTEGYSQSLLDHSAFDNLVGPMFYAAAIDGIEYDEVVWKAKKSGRYVASAVLDAELGLNVTAYITEQLLIDEFVVTSEGASFTVKIKNVGTTGAITIPEVLGHKALAD